MANAAALAMRLVQINLWLGGGNISSADGFLTPIRLLPRIQVPTLPNITFQYRTKSGEDLKGLFDIFIFTLTPNATEKTGIDFKGGSFGKIFEPIGIIRYPMVLLHQTGEMNWPGDGNGPRHTSCLASPCGLGRFFTCN